MRVHNCIIVTDDDSRIEMELGESVNFAGNRVFNRDSLPAGVFDCLKLAVDSGGHDDPAATEPCGAVENKESIG